MSSSRRRPICGLIPSMNGTPRATSWSSGEPLSSLHRLAADSMSLKTMVRQAVRLSLPLVRLCRKRTVANVLSIRLCVRNADDGH
jgi:hypothetical protein